MEFEYDENKSQSNLKKHRIAFIGAAAIWEGGIVEIGRAIRQGEERITAVGEYKGHAVTVVYTWRGEKCRIISARPANRTERAYRDEIVRRG